MPPVDGTYAPRSPDLSTFSSSANDSNQANTNTNASSYTGAYQAPRLNSTAQKQPPQPQEREGGYTPRSPKIPPYDFTSTEPPTQSFTDTRRTSVYQPPISPQYQQGYRRHSTYQPPILDPPPAHTSSTWGPPTHTSNSYTSPIYASNSTTSIASQPHHEPPSYPPRGNFSQAQRSGYSILQSVLTYQSPAQSQQHPQPHLYSPVEVKRELVDINLLTHPKSAPPAPQSVISPTGANSASPFSSLKLEDSTTSVKEKDRDSKMADIKTEINGGGGLDADLGASKGIEVKTKFPVARIKRIMQADEEVGKVAQVTPVVVSKALELFMISLVTKSADLARAGNSKRVTAVHLKKTIEGDEQFDFLNDIVAKVADQPDAGQEKGKGRKKEDSESGEDEKPKKKGRRKKEE